MKTKPGRPRKLAVLERDTSNENVFESTKFTTKQLEEILWDALIGVKSGRTSYDKAMATTGLARTACMLAKLRHEVIHASKTERAISRSISIGSDRMSQTN